MKISFLTHKKKLINICEFKWEDQYIQFYENNNPIKTFRTNQTNKTIYKNSLGKFEKYKKDLNI